MFDSRKQQRNCNFTEEVVSYIYDEMSSDEKAVFEIHLAECSPCVDEIAAFSSVSFSIKQWRDEEFAELETPPISIPYETEESIVRATPGVAKEASWFDNLLGGFNLSPAFLKTATAFGTIGLAIGLAWFLLSTPASDDNSLADADKQETQTVETQPIRSQNPVKTTIADAKDSIPAEEADKDNESVIISTPKLNNQKKVTNKKVVTDKSRPNKVYKRKSVQVAKNRTSNPVQNDKTVKPEINKENIEIKEIPRLTDFAMEETEERDLRLTDFSEDEESGDE